MLLWVSSICASVAGDWHGLLNPGFAEVTLVLHIEESFRGFSAKIDTLEYELFNIPVDAIAFEGEELRFLLSRSSYRGVMHADHTITGTWTQQGKQYPLTFKYGNKTAARPQEPMGPYPYRAEEVKYPNQKVLLSGTLTLPHAEGPCPAMILIGGSGPIDRDETCFGHKPFLVLADHLTRKGIAVLRFDKRGINQSTGAYETATSLDFASDVLASIDYLKTRKEIGSIGLIGHSEGGLIAPIVATHSPELACIVLMAGPGVNGEEIFYLQASIGSTHMCTWLNTPWFRFFLTYEPSTALEQITLPVLAINGALDVQVPSHQNLPMIERALQKAGNRQYKTLELPGLNHLFQRCKTGSVAEYKEIEETISLDVLDLIAEWIWEIENFSIH